MVIQQESVEDYIDLIGGNLEKIITHCHIAKAQTTYLKERKQDLEEETALLLGDFAENYRFTMQNEVQGFYWNNSQCTLHPVVIYCIEDGSLIHRSYCIISDDNNHDVALFTLCRELLLMTLYIGFQDSRLSSILVMAVVLNTKTGTTFLTFVCTRRISKLVQNGTFLPPVMESSHVIASVEL